MHVSGRALCLYFLRHLLRGLGYYGNAQEACRRSACRALSTAISPKVSVARALASGESASSSCLRSVATLKVCSTSSVSVIFPSSTILLYESISTMYSSISKTSVSWSNHGLSVIRRNGLLPHSYGGSVTLNALQLR